MKVFLENATLFAQSGVYFSDYFFYREPLISSVGEVALFVLCNNVMHPRFALKGSSVAVKKRIRRASL